MAGLRIPRAHSNDWYDELARRQRGYYQPWQSQLDDRNGNRALVELVGDLIKPSDRILEVGCGHGELAQSLASMCSHVTA